MENPLSAIIGQKRAGDLLNNINSTQRIPHAFLFKGSEGVGKFFTAIQFLKLINQGNVKETKILSQISELKEPYIKYIMPLPRGRGETNDDGPLTKLAKTEIEAIVEETTKKSHNPYYRINLEKANTIKISSIRDIKKFVAFEYSDIKYRGIIIEDAHLMNDQSQNALLKSLEEPPEGIIFFLITAYPEKLLQTIESRCWSLEFSPLTNDLVQNILMERFDIDEKLALQASYFANGSLVKALNIIENDIESLLENTVSLLRFSMAGKYNMAYNIAAPMIQKSDKEGISILLNLILYWLNDVIKLRNGNSEFYFENYKETIIKYNDRFNSTPIEELFQRIENLKNSISRNISLNVIILNAIFEIGHLGISK